MRPENLYPTLRESYREYRYMGHGRIKSWFYVFTGWSI